jgi:hypothetical protein
LIWVLDSRVALDSRLRGNDESENFIVRLT